MGNVCCEEPTNAGGIIIDLQNAFKPCEAPVLEKGLVQEKLKALQSRPLEIDDSKYQGLKVKRPYQEVNKKFIYEGTWNEDQPEGYGKIYFKNGEYFEGEFKNGKAEGKGRYIFNNGDYFQGDVYENKGNGSGKYVGSLVQYEGQWKNSKPTIGKYRLKKSSTQIIMNDEKQGQIIWTNGNKYNGQIKNQAADGYGKMLFDNGCVYQGQWNNGTFSGFGTFNWPNGRAYKGQYLNGIKHGRGQFIYSDTRRYQGEWKNGQQNGEGKLYENDQIVYQGIFKDGVPLNPTSSYKQSGLITSNIPPSRLSYENN